MSYTIYYRSLFVKTRSNKYIPIIEMGDNNVYDVAWNGRQRRSREFSNCGWLTKGDRFMLTAEEIMAGVEAMIDSVKQQYVNKPKSSYELSDPDKQEYWTFNEVEQRFGYFEGLAIDGNGHCNNTTAQQVRNFFKRGIERAVTLDEITLDVHWCTEYPHYEHRPAHSEDEMLAAIHEARAAEHLPWIGFEHSYVADRILRDQKAERAKDRKRPALDRTTGFVVQFGRDFIYKMSARHMWRTSYLGSAKKYATRSSAEKAAEKLNTCYDSVTQTAYAVAVSKNAETGEWEQAA